MEILTGAELRQRQRFILFLQRNERVLEDREVAANLSWPIRRVNFSGRFSGDLEPSREDQVSEQRFLKYVLRLLGRREILIAVNLEPALSLFSDDRRSALWGRLLSEVIDVPGMLVAVMRTDSGLGPPRRIVEQYSLAIRGELGALAPDHELIRREVQE